MFLTQAVIFLAPFSVRWCKCDTSCFPWVPLEHVPISLYIPVICSSLDPHHVEMGRSDMAMLRLPYCWYGTAFLIFDVEHGHMGSPMHQTSLNSHDIFDQSRQEPIQVAAGQSIRLNSVNSHNVFIKADRSTSKWLSARMTD